MDARTDPLLYCLAPWGILWAVHGYGVLPARYVGDILPEPWRYRDRDLWMVPDDFTELSTDFYFVPRGPLLQQGLEHHRRQSCLLTVKRPYAAAKGWRVVPAQPLCEKVRPRSFVWREGLAQIDWEGASRAPDLDDERWVSAAMARALVRAETVPFADLEGVYVASDAVREQAAKMLPEAAQGRLRVGEAWFEEGCLRP